MNINGENAALFARLDDLCRFAEQGVLSESCFLSPRELHFAQIYLVAQGFGTRFFEWGGYEDAERKKVFLLPEYMEGVKDTAALAEYGYEMTISALTLRGSGYKRLSHRDFLGSVLGLGLKRDVVGDIVLLEADVPTAVVICEEGVARFICDTLTKVGSDTVRISEYALADGLLPKRSFQHISDTVASARLDAVVAALCSLSRERAREAVVAGLVELDYECEERPDRTVIAPATVSVRGYGKFKVNSVSEQTRKGRLRLDADKYL